MQHTKKFNAVDLSCDLKYTCKLQKNTAIILSYKMSVKECYFCTRERMLHDAQIYYEYTNKFWIISSYCTRWDQKQTGISQYLETGSFARLCVINIMYLRAILCTFQISVDFYYVRGVLGNKCAGQHNLKTVHLKVPKREIFNRSDFPDFYAIKSLRVGDFGVKMKKNFKNI